MVLAFLPLAILALIQGITEFLPISSSGHLIGARAILDQTEMMDGHLSLGQELAFDVAVHLGTLVAVLIYFRRDIAMVCLGLIDLPAGRKTERGGLALNLIVASLPIILAGYLGKNLIETMLRDHDIAIIVVAVATGFFGIVLYLADRIGSRLRTSGRGRENISVGAALFIGLAQSLALVPGTSRSGITITAARLLGLDRTLATRFSMLLSVPAILGAGVLLGRDVVRAGDFAFGADALWAMALAFAAALIAIRFLMLWVARASFTPFVLYRIVLAGVLLTAALAA
jgi:undecaprenyl-diphosphatase